MRAGRALRYFSHLAGGEMEACVQEVICAGEPSLSGAAPGPGGQPPSCWPLPTPTHALSVWQEDPNPEMPKPRVVYHPNPGQRETKLPLLGSSELSVPGDMPTDSRQPQKFWRVSSFIFFKRERASRGEGQKEGKRERGIERERIPSRPHVQHRAQRRAQSHDHEIMT